LALGKEIRIIRDKSGYYYIAASGFKNVYLFLPVEGGMKLEETILISKHNHYQARSLTQVAEHRID
jgi:hypothetical protein